MNSLEPKIINLPQIKDDRGNLSFFENFNQLPFEIKRVYWLYDIPGGYQRGGHAFKKQQEFVVALSGSFDITVESSGLKKIYNLNRSFYGLYIPSKCWRFMSNFSTNSVALVVSSILFTEDDYIRNYNDYLNYFSK